MLVSGADLGFVAAAVQSWSLPQFSSQDTTSKVSNAAQKNLALSFAILLLAALANLAQGLVISGSLAGKAVLCWLAAETLYFIYSQTRLAAVNKVVDVPLDAEGAERIKQRFLTLAAFMPVDEFLSGWFQGAPAESILRGNVEDFVAYGFYCRTMGDLPPRLRASVRDFVKQVEVAYGRQLEDGWNPDVTFMAHLWEPLRMLHTPLCVHIASEATAAFAHVLLAFGGFRKLKLQGLGYWYRPGFQDQQSDAEVHRSGVMTRSMAASIHTRGDSASSLTSPPADHPSSNRRPLVFAHGVGFGIAPYLGFLWQVFRASPSHPMILLDMPHVAMRPFRRAVSVDLIAAASNDILHEHGFASACFMGHSFGSFCVSRICQLYPDVVDSIVLMDPVCCLTCYPQLLYSFVYKKYSWSEAASSLSGFANAIRFIFSRDLIIAETFCRQFLWYSLMLWPEDMPAKAVLSVSANDDLVPARLVQAHLKSSKSPATILFHPTAAHGGIFLDAEHQLELVAHTKRLLSSA